MGKTDRYILSRLMILFGFFTLVLVAIYWINRAVVLFDTLIGGGHSALVFFEFSALSLPSIILMALPLSTFAAAVYVLNRLISDSEMVVLQTTGFSPWRLARPFLHFGLLVALMMSLLTHYLVPKSQIWLDQRQREIAQSITTKLLSEGTFLHPSDGVTFYIRDITPEGILTDIFLSDDREGGTNTTFTASEAYLVRDGDSSKLVMLEGMAQTLSVDGRLSITNFRDFTYDVGAFLDEIAPRRPRVHYLPTFEMIFETDVASEKTGARKGVILEQGHARFAQALFCIVVTLFACSSMIQGSFSRFGPARYIVFSLLFLIVIKILESAVSDPVRNSPELWPLVYLPSGLGLLAYVVQQSRNSGWLKIGRSRNIEVAA